MPEAPSYRVLARKYRPTTLAELVGQDVLVRTLTNAFSSGRIAHAFLLTGVRGVGKTTTARILARALNCAGPDGKGGPTVTPCGVCDNCKSIADDRAVDVLEMDAATHTGVDDIRALTEGARYAPAAARTKVYILDEVHMLSKAAFNALLKTLEEPPPHVTFVFATTEARKLPLTILSRCQRFDLRRVEPDLMAQHLTNISAKENVTLEPEAAAMLGRAADGSVRDGLSLLDQAMALATDGVTPALVQEMLGLADRGATLDLLDSLLAGNVAASLGNLRSQYDLGADPVLVLQDLLDLVHWLTRLKAVPNITERNARTAAEQERGRAVATKVSMPTLARAWSMLLKGLEEAGQAPDPMAAIEMVLVRLAYVAELPSPAEVVEKLTQRTSAEIMARPVRSAPIPPPQAIIRDLRAHLDPRDHPKPNRPPLAPIITTRAAAPPQQTRPLLAIPDFDSVVALAGERGEPKLRAELISGVHLISYAPGAIEFRLATNAAKDLPGRLQRALNGWTGQSWSVVAAKEGGAPTLAERETARKAQRVAEAKQDPAVQAVLAAFPGAEIREVRDVEKTPEPPPSDDIPPPSDEDIF